MKFYNGEIELYDLDVEDSSYRMREVMGAHELTLMVKYPEPLTLPVGCHVEFEGIRYFLFRPEHVKKNGGRHFEYTIVMHPYSYELSKYKLRNPVDKRLKFSYHGTPAEHLSMIIDNLNLRGTGWAAGVVTEAQPKLINYNHTSLSDALRLIATQFETEYEVDGKTIDLGRVEYNKTEPLVLSYRQGFKAGISRQNTDNTKPVEILYVQGGERNIDPSTYGGRELLLPKGQTIEYEGRQYVVDADGMSIRRADKELSTYEEESLDLSHIYPKREGEVSTVIAVDAGNNFYDITDTTIPEALNYNDYLVAGEKMTIVFQSGMLAGREFDVNYTHATRLFEIVPQEYDGVTMPGGAFLPAQGDKYIVYGCSMPDAYLRDDTTQTGASWDMLREAVKYLRENEDPRYSFLGEMDGIWSKSLWLEIGGKIRPGGYVMYSDQQIAPEGVLIRIMSVRDFVNSPHKPKVELSNMTITAGLKDQIKKPDQDEVVIDDKHRQGLDFTRRRFRDAQETISMLQAAFDDFDPAIDPIAIQTMSLLVGAESLQFRFVNSKTAPSVVTPNIVYSSTQKKISVPSGIIQHMSIGITSISAAHEPAEYRFWNMPSYTSPALTDGDKSYYFYAWVAKSGDTGAFLLKETAMPFDSGDYYYLLVGTLGKEIDGARSYTSVYGFSEILPGRITTDMIKSPTGQTYFNLSAGNGAGEIGGVIKFLAGSSGLDNLPGWQDLVQDVEDASTAAGNAESAASALDYIKQAILDGSTTVAGGLVLANLLMLKGTDNVVRAGLSGLQDDNVFLFADPSNAYAKALEGTAMFLMRKDGTSKLGIMKIDTDNVGLYKDGTEMMQFRTSNVPSRNDLISSVNQTEPVPGGTATHTEQFSDDFGNSDPIVVASPISSFSLNVAGVITLSSDNDYYTPIIVSEINCRVVLERLSGSSWVQDRILASYYYYSEQTGIMEQVHNLDSTINLSAGSYRVRVEYNGSTNSVNDSCTISSSIAMHAQGAQANKAIIFGENGLVRIKDGTNYSLFSDEAVEHKFDVDKYLLIDSNGIKARGGFDVPGLRAAGSVNSAGNYSNLYGKASSSVRNGTGVFTVYHSLGHTEYSVNLTLYNTNAQRTAVVTNKQATSFSVRIVNPNTNAVTDSAFEFSVYASA